MKSRRLRSTVLLFALPLLLFSLCSAVAFHARPEVSTASPEQIASSEFWSSRKPTPTEPPYINISRADYERALARWRSQGIDEYEVVEHYEGRRSIAGSFIFRVHSDQVSLVNYTLGYGTGQPIDPSKWDQDTLRDFTIASAFAWVKSLLDDPNDIVYCTVLFDWMLGYPVNITCKGRPNVIDADNYTSFGVSKIYSRWGTPLSDPVPHPNRATLP